MKMVVNEDGLVVVADGKRETTLNAISVATKAELRTIKDPAVKRARAQSIMAALIGAANEVQRSM